MAGYLLVSTTTDSRDRAVKLLRSAVREQLAASGQVLGPALSAFWHEGEFGEGEEWQVFFKTTKDRYAELQAHLVVQHARQNPEITAVDISDGSPPYLDWIDRATS
jgi:periplasmic divalent cation tolerance protein